VGRLFLPTEGQVRGRDHFDKVHEVVGLLVSVLIRVVERVDVVVSPTARTTRKVLLLHILDHDVAQLRAKTQMMNGMCESVASLILEEIFQIVHMQVPVRERLSRRNVKVSNDLVDANATLNAATFPTLLVEMFGVVFALALLDTLAATEGPGNGGVGIADLVARVAAAGP
jgi:hypothetical protein